MKRLISYRAISDLPLVAVIGRADKTIFQQADASYDKYVMIGVALTAAVLFVVLLVAHRQAQMLSTSSELYSSKKSLEQSNRVLDETKQFLNSIIENIPVSVVVKDAATRKYILVNRAFENMVEMPRCDLLGRTVFDIFRAKDAAFMDRTDTEAAKTVNDTHYKEYEVEKPKGGERIQGTRRIVVRDDSGEPKYLIAVIDDITERKRVEHRIAYLAHHDGLTGLVNRTALLQKIEEAGARSRRLGEAFSVLLLDLDRFKQVNDSMGHPVGDRLLCEVAARLRGLLRETDVLARLGGDEFAIIQAGDAGSERAAAALAGRVIACIGRPFVIDGVEITVGTSIGIALAPEHHGASDELLKMADLALYCAKAAGRNGFRFFDPQMSAVASARQQIESDLRRAIQQNELEVHYQPIIDCKTGKISSAEALVRWRHPVKGLIYPDSFIPIAEETGLITLIGDRVLRAWAGGLPAREAVGEPDSGMAATTVGDGWFAGASRSWSGGAASAGGRSSTTLTRFTSAGAGGPSICEFSVGAFRKPGSHRTPHAANATTPTTKPNRATINHRFRSPRRGRNDGSGIRLGASASWRCSSSIARSPIKAWPAMSSRFWVSVTNRWSEDRAGGKRNGGSSSSRWRIGELISVKLRRVQCSYCSTCTYLARRSIHRS